MLIIPLTGIAEANHNADSHGSAQDCLHALGSPGFSPDYRKTMFGHPLDHIFTRGFTVRDSHTVQVNTSDHNPLIITLNLKKV